MADVAGYVKFMYMYVVIHATCQNWVQCGPFVLRSLGGFPWYLHCLQLVTYLLSNKEANVTAFGKQGFNQIRRRAGLLSRE